MAGAVQRPAIDPSQIDAVTAPLVPRLGAAMAKGDDGTLREIIAIFEENGFTVVGAHELAPDLLPQSGVLSDLAPAEVTPDLDADLAAADAALAQMAQADLGQAVLTREGAVIAREDSRGTAAMLGDFSSDLDRGAGRETGVFGIVSDAVTATADWVSRTLNPLDPLPGAGAVLHKGPKPGQSLLADMPLIGPETAMQAAEAGLDGIVIKSGGVMVLDLDQVLTIINGQGMYLWVRP